MGNEIINKLDVLDTNRDKKLRESEILTFFYEDIYNIQQEFITLLLSIGNNQ